MPYQLVREHLSTDTVEALEQILESARRGDVIGISYALMLRRQKYLVDCAGEACTNPFLARAGVAVLDDHIADAIHGRSDRHTTM